ncbi:MAG: glycosyltransferase family A protein [Bacteroidales bacterium]|nr:glycosyltransferase family A protein [Bacteroidales bacterium]MDD4820982.1 glycosyltransferase family A protein [Bacteroidales bacterium]
MKKINCFLPYATVSSSSSTIDELRKDEFVGDIVIMGSNYPVDTLPEGCKMLTTGLPNNSETLLSILENSQAEYTLIYTKNTPFKPGLFALQRFLDVLDSTQAPMAYSDYYHQDVNNERAAIPLIDCGSWFIRDDFNFGPLLVFRTTALERALQGIPALNYSALYRTLLLISLNEPLIHIPEFLYTEMDEDIPSSREKQFDYVNPKNREVQVEMERSFLECLKQKGAWLAPQFKEIDLSEGSFDYEASVIIPVRNRKETIKDAIESVLKQKTKFPFNLIVIDNHSTDGTSDIIASYAGDSRVVHLIPERTDLCIGGCWNYGVNDARCGRFAVQLDSDDMYFDERSLQIMVEAFYYQKCAMVVGSYLMTDFYLKEIPPGVIDHSEWTKDNGRNNLLRVNGLGAPRAFFTPLLRRFRLPDTSYGEDYAVGLRISREYRIGRVYDVVYCCRRWGKNTDSSLSIEQINKNNRYKDAIRRMEIEARIQLNRK